jgi:intracellular multiplication protein IcmP
MMPAPASPRPAFASPDDYTLFSLAVIVLGTVFGGWMLWHFHHRAVSEAVMALAHWQMQVIALFTDRYRLADAQIRAADPARVEAWQLVRLLGDIGLFFRLPAVLLASGLGLWCFLRAAPARFCRDLDLEALIREQARSFPVIRAFVRRRLRLVPLGRGEPRPADPALHAGEWVERYATGKSGAFDETKARGALRRQLGPLWRGRGRAAPHVRCLLAVFALHRAQMRQEAQALLGALSASLPDGSGDGAAGPELPLRFPAGIIATADRWLDLVEVGEPALRVAARHGFTATALMSVLTAARQAAGVLPPGQFAWLKLVDRLLFYALHSLGFPTDGLGEHVHPNPRVEAIGARDHWAVELASGGPVLVPAVDRALGAIRAAVGQADGVAKHKEV